MSGQIERNHRKKKELYLLLCHTSMVKHWNFENYKVIISYYRCNPGNRERSRKIIIYKSFKRCFSVVLQLIWRRDVGQRQINIERMMWTSTLEFTKLNSVESGFSISTLISTMLGSFKKTLSFSTSIFTTLGNVETTSWIWSFVRN